ncbi:ArsR/SmtB family transcription factor [Burkholderia sp. Z1]|uniref:ArsR/SmtB family transcription factor n=1 Tax=Burkholderia sp. Z1 TaxID=2759039 RepID=UPI001D028738|nr:hypothetical protein [Burkholderia sp. Z1]
MNTDVTVHAARHMSGEMRADARLDCTAAVSDTATFLVRVFSYYSLVRKNSYSDIVVNMKRTPHHDPAAAVPANLPDPLPEPAVSELRLDAIFGALADPLRLTIVRRLLLESEAYDHPCSWFGFNRAKSSLTHHFKALREAGVIRQRQYGLERRSRVRTEDLDARFPGLLQLVIAWEPSGDEPG